MDNLLAPSLRQSIEVNLGKSTLNKIEQRLMERHGLGIVQAIKDFHKFDSVLREFFGAGADGLETKFLQNIIDLKQQKKSTDNWIVIQEQSLAKIFLHATCQIIILTMLSWKNTSRKGIKLTDK